MVFQKSHRGFLAIEIILAITTIGVIALALGGLFGSGQEATQSAGQRVTATLLAEEGMEAVRSIRDEDFFALAPGTYGLSDSLGARWALDENNPDTVDDFYTREITITDIPGASLDNAIREVRIEISWEQRSHAQNITLVSRFTNWQDVVIPEDEEIIP